MKKTYEFVTAKGNKIVLIAEKKTVTERSYSDGWVHEYTRTLPMSITGVEINGQYSDARQSMYQNMYGAMHKLNGKDAFVPVPKYILDDINADQMKRIEKDVKIEAELRKFNRFMDKE